MSWIAMGDLVFLSMMAKPLWQRSLLMHLSSVSTASSSGVGVKSSRNTSANSSGGSTSIPRARMSCATAWRTSSLRRISSWYRSSFMSWLADKVHNTLDPSPAMPPSRGAMALPSMLMA